MTTTPREQDVARAEDIARLAWRNGVRATEIRDAVANALAAHADRAVERERERLSSAATMLTNALDTFGIAERYVKDALGEIDQPSAQEVGRG